ncbi:ChrR family anti-sigma-E factor [Pseudemcibacter sp.]|jgi:putative transcriptional regulator|uniref:ChrR family anti-sigma-E factor n=1 Tax=Pseudemcibacter sp. TaxID=2943293 RepID=UPI0023258204|nr:transcriptional regulator [Kordiimonadaceae bacterium]MDA7569224.1 ChrR family anti-sigma-E factor [Emcibacteraceae bacterium]
MMQNGMIPEEWVVSYAAGSLSEAHALVVASHIDYHPELQEKLADAEAIGGLLLENTETSSVSDDMFNDILGRLDEEIASFPQMKSKSENHLPKSLSDYLDGDLDDLKWKKMGPGLSQVRLWTGPNDERLWLLRAKGGTKVPMHDHRSLEMTLVLQGGYSADGEQYKPGMIEVADEHTHNHQPIINEGEECICLVVTEAPIKIHGIVGKILQPFIGL